MGLNYHHQSAEQSAPRLALVPIKGRDIMTDTYTIIGGNCGSLETDSRLIAAAPDLLQALTWLACEADEDMPSEYRTDSFRAALDAAWEAVAKAEGAAA